VPDPEGKVTVMAVPYRGGPELDLYQLLGVARDAPARDITHAWRRKARGTHPDSRPQDTGAAARFRVLEQAYRVLSDPARRAAYDQALRQARPAPGPRAAPPAASPASQAPLRVTYRGGARRMTPAARAPGPPLWAGPVLISRPDAASAPDERRERARLAAMAELAARYLGENLSWPW
jgi:curved DNA-binding protein CbpA